MAHGEEARRCSAPLSGARAVTPLHTIRAAATELSYAPRVALEPRLGVVEVDPKNPKTIGGILLLVVAGVTGGSFLGYTVEPEEMTTLRVDNATLTERASNLEAQVEDLGGRVEVLEDIVDDCRRILARNTESP
jgi:hypothetical protein